MKTGRLLAILTTLVTVVCVAAPAQAAVPPPIPGGCWRLPGFYYSASNMGVTIGVTAWDDPPTDPTDRIHVGDVSLRRDRFGLHVTSVSVDPDMLALGYEASILRADAPVGDWVHVLFSSEQSATDYHFVAKRLSATGGGIRAVTATC